jgi:hypothetical protein
MSEDLEFERRQLEYLVGKAGYEIVELQETETYVAFKIRKLKAKRKRARK